MQALPEATTVSADITGGVTWPSGYEGGNECIPQSSKLGSKSGNDESLESPDSVEPGVKSVAPPIFRLAGVNKDGGGTGTFGNCGSMRAEDNTGKDEAIADWSRTDAATSGRSAGIVEASLEAEPNMLRAIGDKRVSC